MLNILSLLFLMLNINFSSSSSLSDDSNDIKYEDVVFTRTEGWSGGWSDEEIKKCHENRKQAFSSTKPYNNADEIIPHLWIGNICTAANDTFLFEERISIVINMASEWDFLELGWRSYKSLMTPFRYYIRDPPNDAKRKETTLGISIGNLKDGLKDKDVLEHLKEASRLIKSFIEYDLNVLVVCNVGKSRSVTAVIHYLMNLKKLYGFAILTDPDYVNLVNKAIPVNDYTTSLSHVYDIFLQFIKKKRPVAQPNILYEHILKGLESPVIYELSHPVKEL